MDKGVHLRYTGFVSSDERLFVFITSKEELR